MPSAAAPGSSPEGARKRADRGRDRLGAAASPLRATTAIVSVGLALAIGTFPLVTPEARAQFLWDGASPGDNTANGGTGNWDASGGGANNWVSGGTSTTWTDDSDAVFGVTGGTVTITGGGVRAINSATFNVTGYTITNGTIALSGPGPTDIIVTNAGDSATIESVIADGTNNSLRKAGAGTLTLTGVNTYTGTTTVDGGTLALTGAGSLVSTTINISDGTLRTDGGALAAGSAITLSGPTSVLDIDGTENLGAASSLSLVGVGANVDIAAGQTLGVGTIFTDDGTTINVGAGSTLAGLANTLNNGGVINVADGGSVTDVGAINNLATGQINFAGSGTLDSDTDNDTDGPVTNDGQINLNGNNTQIVQVGPTGNNDLINQNNGEININAGRLDVDGALTNSSPGAAAGGAGGVDIQAGGILNVAGALTNNAGGEIVNDGGTLNANGGQIDNNAGATLTSTGTVTGGIVNDGIVNAEGTFNGIILNQGTGTFTVTANLAGDSGFTNAGTATLTVNAGATYSGLTSLAQSGGTINGAGIITTVGAFTQSGGTTGGTVDINAGSFTQSGGGIIATGTFVTSAGAQTLSGGTIAGTLDGAGAVTVTTGATSLTGLINGAASLTVNSGSLAETGAGSIDTAGNTITVTGGALSTDGNGIADDENVSVSGGTFTLSGADTINALSVSGTGTATVNAPLTLVATLTQSGGTINGTSTIAVGTSFTQSGGTTGGTVDINAGSFTQSGGGIIAAGTFVTSAGAQTLSGGTIAGTLDGAGAISFDTTTTTVSGTIINAASLTGNSGTLSITAAGTVTIGAGGIINNAAATITNAGNLTGNVTNAGTLNTTGTVTGNVDNSGTLNGAGTITGNLSNLAGGTLNIGTSPGTLAIGGNLVLNAGSVTNFELGEAGVAGGPNNDLITVGGTTQLGGTLNLTAVGFGQVQSGYYQLIQSTGAVSGTFATVNAGTATARVYTTTNGGPDNVNVLVNAPGQFVQFWDGADQLGVAGAGGGTGTWNPTNTNWTTNPDGSDPFNPAGATINDSWQSGVGVFGGAAGTVTVAGGPLDFQGLQFIVDGYTVTGGGLNMTGNAPGGTPTQSFINVEGAGNTATINSAISGAGVGLIKGSAGTLVLSGANTFTGPVTVNGGTLRLLGGSALADTVTVAVNGGQLSVGASETIGSLSGTGGGIGIDAGQTLTVNQSVAGNFAGAFSGSGFFVKSGGQSLTLTGNSGGFAGSTNVQDGLLQLLNAQLGGPVTVGGAGTLGLLNSSVGGAVNVTGIMTSFGTSSTGPLTLAPGSRLSMSQGMGGAGVAGDVLNVAGNLAIDPASTLVFDVNLSGVTGVSDRINATGDASGGGSVVFNPVTATSGLQAAPTVVIDAATAAALNFDPANVTGLPSGGIVEYSFQALGSGDWGIVSSANLAGIASVGASISTTQALIATVVNRPSTAFVAAIGQTEPDTCSFGVWSRATGGGAASETGSSATLSGSGVSVSETTEIDLVYGGVQSSFDFGCLNIRDQDSNIHVGLTTGYNAGRTSQDQISSLTGTRVITETEFQSRFIGAYATYTRGDFKAELQGRIDYTDFTFSGLGAFDEIDSTRYALNGLVEYTFFLNDDTLITPQLGFSAARTKIGQLDLGAATLDFQDVTSLVGSASLSIAKVIILPDEISAIQPFATATVYHDFGDDFVSVFTDSTSGARQTIVTDNIGTFGEVSLGVAYARLLEGVDGAPRELSAAIRGDLRFSDRLLSAGVTAQLRLQF
jgi:autotransporter-associated beta strand protein